MDENDAAILLLNSAIERLNRLNADLRLENAALKEETRRLVQFPDSDDISDFLGNLSNEVG